MEMEEKAANMNEELFDINKEFQELDIKDNEQIDDRDEEELSLDGIDDRTIIPNESSKLQAMRLQRREEDEKQFQDEVEYETNELVREKYSDYKYMKSFYNNQWNKYDSLPAFYKNIYTFKDIQQTHKKVLRLHQENSVVFDGFYVTIRI